jgi:hypothetical protein
MSETKQIFGKRQKKLKGLLDPEGLSGYPEDSEIDMNGER